MRAAALLLTVTCLSMIPATLSADVADYLGKPVASLRVSVEGQASTDPRYLDLIETTPGRALSMLAVRESITHLFTLGQFEDVRVSAEMASGGVALTYDLVPLHPIDRIAFDGILRRPGIDEGRLRRAVTDRYGPSPSAGRRGDLTRLIEDDLRQHGYLHPTVTAQIQTFHEPDRATLTFTIDPGHRTVVGAVEVLGNPGLSAETLLKRLELRQGVAFEREAIATRVQNYLARERADGYLSARLTVATRMSEGDLVADLTLTAARGPKVRLEFKGDAIPRDEHDRLVPIAEEASADEDLLEDSTGRIEDYLRTQGYRDAKAPHERTENADELLITFTVTKGALYRNADVLVNGNQFESLEEIMLMLRLRKGEPYSTALLDADVAGIEDFYRRAGFASVAVTTEIEPAAGATEAEVPVIVKLSIAEGTRTVVNSVRLQGNDAVPADEILPGLGMQPGRPFFLTQLAVDRDAIQLLYANRGYQSVTIAGNPGLSADGGRADIVFAVNEGPRLIVDHVLIVGNEKTKTETIAREIQLKSGDPLSLSAVSESQRRLAELGLFRRVRITQVPHGEESLRDLVVTVEEAPATTVGYGGGIEVLQISVSEGASGIAAEQFEVAPRGFFEIGRRNLFGKNRSINLFTRVSLHPDSDGTTLGFTEYRVFGAFREPRLFGTTADAYLTSTIEQQRRSAFNFSRRVFSAEIGRRLTQTVVASGNYALQRTDLFDENIAEDDQLLIDRLFPEVILSSFSGSAAQTTRDEIVSPGNGHDLTLNGQVAARAIGSEVGFLKTYMTAQLFRTVPQTRGTVFAGSARLGMAYGLPRTVIEPGDGVLPLDGDDGGEDLPAIAQTVTDLPASERFFAGGDTTVRGFALDQLGTPETLDKNGLALGGNAVLIFNAELRVPVRGGFGVVTFIDVGNVFRRTSDIELRELRSAVGFGIRYRSPIGPLRVDLGFKTHRNELAPGRLESASALHISLGQAF